MNKMDVGYVGHVGIIVNNVWSHVELQVSKDDHTSGNIVV